MSTVLEQIQYGFDRNSQRTWQRRSLTDTQDQQYNYDALSQVAVAARGSLNLNRTAISGRPASAQSWDYDPTGNWRGCHAAANGTTTLDQHRVHDRGNRLTQIEGNPNSMILDRVGRMRQMAPDAGGDWDGKLEITWDAWSRITRVKNNGEVVGDYAYDGSHRRITREADGETLHSYYNDAWRPVEERKDAETTAAMSYLWGARHRDDLVRRDRATSGTSLDETRYILMDYYNPVAITDEVGAVKERYAFSAFGMRTILNPDFTERSSSECGLEFAFQGQFLDEESGLMNYGYRYYSPYMGRWTCKDPIGEIGGINLYAYTMNNGVNKVDLLGLHFNNLDAAGIEGSKAALALTITWLAANLAFYQDTGKGLEYQGYICHCKCGSFDYTPPTPAIDPVILVKRGDPRGGGGAVISNSIGDALCKKTFGKSWAVAGWYHSHPDLSSFSEPWDAKVTNMQQLPGFVGRQGGVWGNKAIVDKVEPKSANTVKQNPNEMETLGKVTKNIKADYTAQVCNHK